MPHPLLRELPPVGALLDHPQIAPLAAGRRRAWVTRVVQQTVESLRRELADGSPALPADREQLAALARDRVEARIAQLLAPCSRRVINATGVVVHTNLGRSCWPERAVAWASAVAAANSDLEFVLDTGKRGHRGRQVEAKLALLAGAEDALIINNNAAAVWLATRHLTRGGRLVLSRGEVVAIGGSFRLHEILAETHCELVEVGTTNRTGLADYEAALTEGAVVMKVHRSNFAVTGFTEEVALPDLAALCRRHGCKLIYDAGSGALFPFQELGLPPEPTLAADLAAGADLVTCSGDKLLGGCQAGLILGSQAEIDRLRAHPMRRAFRVDKTTLAALDAVLTLYLEAEDLPALPTLQNLARTVAELEAAAAGLRDGLAPHAPPGWTARIEPDVASVGGGSFSSAEVPTRLLVWSAPRSDLEAMHRLLRTGDPALVGRMSQEGLGIDLRTVMPQEHPLVIAAFSAAWQRLNGETAR
jgi:L-seryl-tRNA(Ser) seleniumtransferase